MDRWNYGTEGPPTVTVIIPTFNRDQYLGEAIRSILCQTYPPAQVIVVDDGSTDSTREVASEFGDRIEFVAKNNGGKSTAVNAGLNKAKGRYTWIFDDDDVALPDALERVVETLEDHPDCGFCYSGAYYAFTNPETHGIGPISGESDLPRLGRQGLLLALAQRCFLGGARVFARTECYRDIGGFDEALVRSQDYDFALRLAARFRGVRTYGGPTFLIRVHAGRRGTATDSFQTSELRARHAKYNRTLFAKFARETPLELFLPEGRALAGNYREALLRRMRILASHGAFDVVLCDVEELCSSSEAWATGSVTRHERRIIAAIAESLSRRGLDVSTLTRLSESESPAARQMIADIQRFPQDLGPASRRVRWIAKRTSRAVSGASKATRAVVRGVGYGYSGIEVGRSPGQRIPRRTPRSAYGSLHRVGRTLGRAGNKSRLLLLSRQTERASLSTQATRSPWQI